VINNAEDKERMHLQLENALLNGARDHEPHNMDGLVLAQPMNAVLRLRLLRQDTIRQ
jgi:hypothetical protein